MRAPAEPTVPCHESLLSPSIDKTSASHHCPCLQLPRFRFGNGCGRAVYALAKGERPNQVRFLKRDQPVGLYRITYKATVPYQYRQGDNSWSP